MDNGNDALKRLGRRIITTGATAVCIGALAAGTTGVASAAPAPAPAATAATAPVLDPAQFQGVNWADPRDNFVDGPVVPSGLYVTDDYATVYAKSLQILQGFKTRLGANTVRLPVNPYSTDATWGAAYRATVDAATELDIKVILSYWEGSEAKDGKIDDMAAWTAMWKTLTRTYASNELVYFEPMNEPFGYSDTDLRAGEAKWIADHPDIPRNRIFISGTGYNDHTSTQCSDPALAGTYITQHFYGFWHVGPTYADWRAELLDRVAGCEGRLVIDEFGAPMTAGYDYVASATGTPDAERNEFVAYMQATADVMQETGSGGVYWPGLRNGDSYSMTNLVTQGDQLSLSLNSPSAYALLQWAWGRSDTRPHSIPQAG